MATNSSEAFPNYMLYAMYNQSGPVFELILPAVLLNAIGVPGVVCNVLLIYVTWRTRWMRGSTNCLLALTAFFEILHQSSHFVFLSVVASGTNFVPYYVALRFQCHSIFGVMAAQMAMVSTAADRLLSVLFPWTYKSLNGPCYLLVHTLLAVCCGGTFAVLAVLFSLRHPYLPVTGYIADLLISDLLVIYSAIMALCTINTVLYALVWVVVKTAPNGDDHHSKLFRSLIVIVTVVIGGYAVNNVCKLVVNAYFSLSDVQMWMVAVFGGILLNIGASSEAPILYAFSSDYRRAFLKELPFLAALERKKNTRRLVTVAGVVTLQQQKAKLATNLRRITVGSQVVPIG